MWESSVTLKLQVSEFRLCVEVVELHLCHEAIDSTCLCAFQMNLNTSLMHQQSDPESSACWLACFDTILM